MSAHARTKEQEKTTKVSPFEIIAACEQQEEERLNKELEGIRMKEEEEEKTLLASELKSTESMSEKARGELKAIKEGIGKELAESVQIISRDTTSLDKTYESRAPKVIDGQVDALLSFFA